MDNIHIISIYICHMCIYLKSDAPDIFGIDGDPACFVARQGVDADLPKREYTPKIPSTQSVWTRSSSERLPLQTDVGTSTDANKKTPHCF